MKCIKCGGKAAVEVTRAHSAFCPTHFIEYFDRQVERAIKDFDMFTPEDRIAVAVSGGKDSLALWDVLLRKGYDTLGIHIALGIGEYSEASRQKTEAFAAQRNAPLKVIDLEERYHFGVDELPRRIRRAPCSGCGLTKRYLLNRIAYEEGCTVLATGHNLDDEAATLLGNVLWWQEPYLAHQSPALPSTHPKLVKRVKPFYRLTEKETASYAVLRGIDYIVDECPMSRDAQTILLKQALNLIERKSPGAKHNFVFGFLEKARPLFAGAPQAQDYRECVQCGQPTTSESEVCAFCHLLERLEGRPLLPVVGL
jgi:uncharacterized protein (TIGR00269 family)